MTASNPVAVPAPTALNVAAGTLVTCRWTWAVVPGLAAGAGPLRARGWPSFTAISVATSAITTATLPLASRTRPRTWALRLAAIFCWAFPVLAFAPARAALRACARALVRVAFPIALRPLAVIYYLRT